MPEHRIRLRAAWERRSAELASMDGQRLDLPTQWPAGWMGLVRIGRKFGRPPFDPQTESVRLDFRDVVGLRMVRLNDRVWEPSVPLLEPWSIPIEDVLSARNDLELVVDGELAAGSPNEWGSIALVISSREAPEV